eukprot:EG_transcript_15245
MAQHPGKDSSASASPEALPRSRTPSKPLVVEGVRTAQNVGLHAAEVYIPAQYFSQAEMERVDGFVGKYTEGLGQRSCTFAADNEDVVSMALTVVRALVEKHGLRYDQIGRVDVGTETPVDQGKSVKSFLMRLFGDHHAVEGTDVYNACYGGTAALLNSVAWMQSRAWDGRLGLVVAVDLCPQEEKFAFFQGAAAVAMLVGPDAPIVIELEHCASYMEDTYDFLKPLEARSPFPVVANHRSIQCYLRALDVCQATLRRKLGLGRITDWADFIVAHSPNVRMAHKATELLCVRDTQECLPGSADLSFTDVAETEPVFQAKAMPSLGLQAEVGSSYTASVYVNLVSLLSSVPGEELAGKRLLLYSYGSGCAATLYTMHVRQPLPQPCDVQALLQSR